MPKVGERFTSRARAHSLKGILHRVIELDSELKIAVHPYSFVHDRHLKERTISRDIELLNEIWRFLGRPNTIMKVTRLTRRGALVIHFRYRSDKTARFTVHKSH